jgi:hypothetical protein
MSFFCGSAKSPGLPRSFGLLRFNPAVGVFSSLSASSFFIKAPLAGFYQSLFKIVSRETIFSIILIAVLIDDTRFA